MTETEELKSAFEWCATMPGCKACPLEYKYACRYRIMQWAYKRMNAQEKAIANLKEKLKQRVLTLQEVRESFGNPMWFESHGTFLGEKGCWCLSHGTVLPFNIVISTPTTDGQIRLGLADYNKVWRAWNFKPSEEQMKNTPWEENNE